VNPESSQVLISHHHKEWQLTVLKYSMPVAAKLAAISGEVTMAATG